MEDEARRAQKIRRREGERSSSHRATAPNNTRTQTRSV